MFLRAISPTLLVALGCDSLLLEDQPREAQCARDDDCTLLPSALTCCVECAPTAPFQPAPSWVLDGMLIENETVCAASTHPCMPIACEPPPEGCVARAACVAGRCVTVAVGCDRPNV